MTDLEFMTLVAFARLDDRFATSARERDLLNLLASNEAKDLAKLLVSYKNKTNHSTNKKLETILKVAGR